MNDPGVGTAPDGVRVWYNCTSGVDGIELGMNEMSSCGGAGRAALPVRVSALPSQVSGLASLAPRLAAVGDGGPTPNPCGVGIGEKAYFRIGVRPESFPDEKIVWEAEGGLEFAGGGNTKREVCVTGG